jgi:hypothetical protein
VKERLRFLPLLGLYISIILIASVDRFESDEARYVQFANNLSHGFYSPEGKISLWSGPGYPIVLLPFALLKLPWLTAKLLNAVFLFLAIIYFYYTLRLYMSERSALLFSYVLGLYFPLLRYIHRLLTEQLAIFLICGFLFHFCRIYRGDKRPGLQILIASIFLGYLALTKIFFGYVILSSLVIYIFLYLWKKREAFKRTVLVYLFALLLCTPYLFYTYNLTGKVFYWGTSGGINLYLMTTDFEGGLGDWSVFKRHKKEIFKGMEGLTAVQIDEELKRRAIINIINKPAVYLRNWLANIGRYLFNYPFSYDIQKTSTYFYIVPNMFIVVLSVLCIYPTYVGRSKIPYELYTFIVFALISFGGNSLLFALNRYFWPIVPIFLFWIAFTLTRILRIEIQQR